MANFWDYTVGRNYVFLSKSLDKVDIMIILTKIFYEQMGKVYKF